MVNKDRFINEVMDLSMIVHRINRSIGHGSELGDIDPMPPVQFQTLVTIKKTGIVNMTELASSLMMTRQQLTKIVDALVERGYVARGNDPTNRRYVMVELAEEGNRYIEDVFLRGSNSVTRMLELLSDEDAEIMLSSISAIKSVLSRLSVAKQAQPQ